MSPSQSIWMRPCRITFRGFGAFIRHAWKVTMVPLVQSLSAAAMHWGNIMKRILAFSNSTLLMEMFNIFCAWKSHPQGRYHVRKMFFTYTYSTHRYFCTVRPGGDPEPLCPGDVGIHSYSFKKAQASTALFQLC